MSLSCSRCERSIEVVGERPSFCPYCGQLIPGSTPPSRPSVSTEPGKDETVDFHHADSTVAYAGMAPPVRAIPENVAGYRLIRKLGQGGMGSVHEAEEMASGRRVALKLMAPEYTTSATAVERFLQEGRLASSIAHPRCVFVLAADRSDGWPFIVMELMPGHTLKDLVEREGPLPQGEAVRKILDVIEGLQEAHKLGVIHRDVKPSNCFLDGDGRVKVGDFGLSKSLLGSDADLTRTGAFLGTPHYASPEQIKGELIDERSDVYSAAATLYYLLTGSPPHQASEPTVALARIVSEQAPSVRTIRPEVWSALDDAVMRGLERDRRRRYRNLEEFREALAPFLPGRVALGRFGLRATAYAFDFLATFMIITVVMLVVGLVARMRGTPLRIAVKADSEVLTGLIIFAYYFVFEVLGSGSPGKRILRLRVVSSRRGGTAGWWESIVRLLTFATIVIVPRRVYTLGFAHSRDGWGTILSIGSFIQLASIPALFLTARAKNGYRGVHELLSGTAVVLLPTSLRRRVGTRRRAARGDEPHRLLRPEGLPDEIGPYRVAGALAWEGDRRVLLGEDVGLGRTVWIVLRPLNSDAVGETRREVGRLARPRWLGAGEIPGWTWDAFVAPGGQPLPELVARRGRLAWHEARGVLEDLASELVAACDDGTLPDALSPERVWIQPDGRLFLIDGLIDPRSGSAPPTEDDDPERRALGLLRDVAYCALGGDGQSAGAVGAPVPGHALDVVGRLCGAGLPYASVAAFLDDLETTRERTPELTFTQKYGHAAYTLITTEIKTWLFPILTVAYFVVIQYMSGDRDIVMPDDDILDSVFLAQSTLWVLLAMVLRDGIGGLLLGVMVVRADGRRASRLRIAWREALRWLPVLALDTLLEMAPAMGPWAPLHEYGPTCLFFFMPFVYVAPALFVRGRYLNDLMAGTAVMPR